MQWMGVNDLRESFLSFFESKGHVRLPSAPLIPQEDDSLLLINSGMAPLKKYFMGLETLPGNRATSCQKCIRTPDIERVGRTSRHGTFFEMLGNFSFGDYFKEEATTWAWEYFIDVLKIPKDKLWVTIFEEDDEAFDIWTKHRGLPDNRVVRMGREDNFWEIGSGPCGPCSEIYYDRGEKHSCGSPDCAVGCDCDRYVEIWNLVFTQFNSDGAGNYTPLEHPNIDTGMGLERLACVMQEVDNLFEVDTMQNIMGHVSKIAGVTYKKDERADVSLRVITDHIRSTVFMVSDGVIPLNEGRGYVLRRLLRRAARHGHLLGIKRPFLFEVCETVIQENSTAYPELVENRDYIVDIIKVEEERFQSTIEQGMALLRQMIDRLDSVTMGKAHESREKIRQMISGADAFRLYDTFGFPLDLTREIAADRGIEIDEKGFLEFMELQRDRARKDHEGRTGVSWGGDVLANIVVEDEFVGYDEMISTTSVLKIVKDGKIVEQVNAGDEAVILLARTPFYAEGGGQVGDTGLINVGKSVFRVSDCKKSPTGHYLHIGQVISGFVIEGDDATAVVEKSRRRAIMRNHTATHLLQAALREVLGSHVHQSGSMVDDKVCRFDFTHFSAVSPEQLAEVEALVNKWILRAMPVVVSEMPMEEAKKLGAMALFGDKYRDVVRVCNIGDGQSIELCGGTHVSNTAQVGLFKLLHESSVAAGVRRIEGTTGEGVLRLIDDQNNLIHSICETLKCAGSSELVAKAQAVSEKLREQQKQIDELIAKAAAMQLDQLTENMPAIGAVHFVSASLGTMGVEALRSTADRLRDRFPDIVGVLSTQEETGGKATLLVFAGKQAVEAGIHAGKLVGQIAKAAGGSGGGKRPDSAMGGVTDASRLPEAFEAAPGIIREILGNE